MHMNHMTCLKFEAAEKFISVECNFRLNEPQNFRFFYFLCNEKSRVIKKADPAGGFTTYSQPAGANLTGIQLFFSMT